MKQYVEAHPWKIIETDFSTGDNMVTESLLSIGNGKMGQRANFEETYSGETLVGSYLAGVYYPDKTRVGWWKNGYPEYFAKVLNSVNWLGLHILLDETVLDLAKLTPLDYCGELDMEKGLLSRSFKIQLTDDILVSVNSERFYSKSHPDSALLRYRLKVEEGDVDFTITSGIEANVLNQDTNYGDSFWENFNSEVIESTGLVTSTTKKTGFSIAASCLHNVRVNGQQVKGEFSNPTPSNFSALYSTYLSNGDEIMIEKYVSICTSFFYPDADLKAKSLDNLDEIINLGYDDLRDLQIAWWRKSWDQADISIEGDVKAQQGIRFNIFQLNQTYSGDHELLNIGPKGFTGEKYGGSTYWDTEAYCLPYYMATAGSHIGEYLLKYRYNHLQKAIENAAKLGFNNGAALYPMVTMNGEECHNEWEITFEEIHRNGAIAYAIYDYSNYTGDESYALEYGIEVLIGIARFWKQRVNWSEDKGKYVMLGVTGPNEYENNVNNNWYTSYLACWCLEYTLEVIEKLKAKNPAHYTSIVSKLTFSEKETVDWQHIIDNMYYAYDESRQIFLQQDGYLDKEQILVKDLDPSNLPLNQKWSWDRILRSCYIKQADVLQGIYFFEARFDTETIRRNFEFYEPRTVHESSLSPCVHSILAARIGEFDKAYEMYLRTARLDLDNYNNDTEDGLHITSMAGTWLSIVKGFGGMQLKGDKLSFYPMLPKEWDSYSFRINFRSNTIEVKVGKDEIIFSNLNGDDLNVEVYGETIQLKSLQSTKFVKRSVMA
ncbi:MAG: glycoside hydrolase family 65 protein [Saprospiraceae bacterium]|nr:glycoside hydrolase family 65 protein [Candidatus Brachybacter algidus]